MEKWKPINGYEGLYEVSIYGNVKSFHKDKNGKSMKLCIQKNNHTNYKALILVDAEGIKKSFRVHRLVAEAFIDNPNNYNYINHKDENKLNNKANNLEWCTPYYNTHYGNSINNMIINRWRR